MDHFIANSLLCRRYAHYRVPFWFLRLLHQVVFRQPESRRRRRHLVQNSERRCISGANTAAQWTRSGSFTVCDNIQVPEETCRSSNVANITGFSICIFIQKLLATNCPEFLCIMPIGTSVFLSGVKTGKFDDVYVTFILHKSVSYNQKCGFLWISFDEIPSVLWHCWLGDMKGIQPVKFSH